jgi:hypothetical protein
MSEESSDDVVSDFPFSAGETKEEEFSCSECERVFDTKRGMNIHMGQVHDEPSE